MWKAVLRKSVTLTGRDNIVPCASDCSRTLYKTCLLWSLVKEQMDCTSTNLLFQWGFDPRLFWDQQRCHLYLFSTCQLFRQSMAILVTSPSLPNTNLGGLNLWWLGSPFSSSYDLFLRGHSYHVTPFHSHILGEWWLAGSSSCGHVRGFARFLFDDYLATNMIMILNKHPKKRATNTWIYSVHRNE